MAHSSSKAATTTKIILIIALPFVGAGVGLLLDIAVASDAVTWFPCIWMYGGIVGLIGSIILAVKSSNKKSQN